MESRIWAGLVLMAGYSPLKVTGMSVGLVQEREEFILPNDAYPVLENAFVWRERIKRKRGTELLGRLQRVFTTLAIGNFSGGVQPSFTGNLYTIAGIIPEANASISIGSVSITSAFGFVWKDFNLDGRLVTTTSSPVTGYNSTISAIVIGATTTLTITNANALNPNDIVYITGVSGTTELNNNYWTVITSTPTTVTINASTSNTYINGGTLLFSPGTINYINGDISLVVNIAFAGSALTAASFAYNPNLPVMGLRSRELNNINNEETVAFDEVYAYVFDFAADGWKEFLPGTIWTGDDSDFFWSTNYWVGDGNQKIFWVTNYSGTSGDPIRYTNGASLS